MIKFIQTCRKHSTVKESLSSSKVLSSSPASALPWGLCIMTITTIPCVGYIAHHELHRRMHNLCAQRYSQKSVGSQPLNEWWGGTTTPFQRRPSERLWQVTKGTFHLNVSTWKKKSQKSFAPAKGANVLHAYIMEQKNVFYHCLQDTMWC